MATALFFTTFLPWGAIGFEFGGAFPDGASGFDESINAWEMHSEYDFFIAIAAASCAIANVTAASGGKWPRADALAIMNFTGGAIAVMLVASTIAMPPFPESLEIMNLVPGGPIVENALRYGVYTALGLAIALLFVGLLQMAHYRSLSNAPTPPEPRADDLIPTETGATAEPFIDPVTGKSVE